jgi:hypothetical protein
MARWGNLPGLIGWRSASRLKALNFPKVIELVVGFLEGKGSPFALVGGLALQAYGVSRATFDLDLVLVADDQEVVLKHMESLGYETLHASSAFSNHVHPDAELGRVDFIYVDSHTSHRLLGPDSVRLTLSGRTLPVPKPEHLVAMKVHAMKNDPSRGFREKADIQALWRAHGLDEHEVQRYFHRAGMEAAFDELKKSI